jgi:hypothetical protein
MQKLSPVEICAQLLVTGGDSPKQAAAKAVVSAALAESLRLGPVAIENSGEAKTDRWNDPRMRKSPRATNRP